jgi:hypothetical protein
MHTRRGVAHMVLVYVCMQVLNADARIFLFENFLSPGECSGHTF